jgi:integrase
MAKKAKLTWQSKTRRWFKSHNYKQFAVSCRQLDKLFPHLMIAHTKEGSQRASEAWWAVKVETLTGHPQASEYTLALDTRALCAEWAKREGDMVARAEIMRDIDTFKTAKKKGVLLESHTRGDMIGEDFMFPESGLWLKVEDERRYIQADITDATAQLDPHQTWGDRIKEVEKVIDWESTSKETSITGLIEKYASHKAPDVTSFRVDTIKRQLTHFAEWLKTDNLEGVDWEMSLADYRVCLTSGSEFPSTHTQSSRMKTAKSFATWLWDTAKVIDEQPRNLRKLGIKLTHKPVKIWSDAQVIEILKDTKGQHRLYLLLMLNCGFYQSDIGQLKKSQVDLEAKTITRARSKTEGMGGKVVVYPLWDETVELLKAHWSPDKELVLTTKTGAPIYFQKLDKETGKTKRKDMVNTTHCQWEKSKGVKYPALKCLRKTGRSKLDDHDSYARFAPTYLAHSTSSAEQSTDETYYRSPSQTQFRAAIKWLGLQWGIH